MFIDESFKFNFFKNRIFRSSPPTEGVEYIKWLDKVERRKSHYWKDLGIYDLIQLSRVGLPYNPHMLIASMCFYDTSTNTFQLPYVMITLTLFDIVSITGIRPTRLDFDLTKVTRIDLAFTFSRITYNYFIKDHQEKTNDILHMNILAFLLTNYRGTYFALDSFRWPKNMCALLLGSMREQNHV